MLIEAINKSTGFKLGVLRKTWDKKLKEAKEEAEAAAAAAGPGPGGAGGAVLVRVAHMARRGGFNQSFAGAFGQFCPRRDRALLAPEGKKWERIAQGPSKFCRLRARREVGR